jgi:hypothetical protein
LLKFGALILCELNIMPIARDRVEQLQVQKLIYAVRTEDVEQVQKLCEKGVEHLVNYNDPQNGMTALM